MLFAIFGITNDGLNLAASLILLMLVALYIALIVYTFLDSRRRIDDPFLVACATAGALIPFIGTAVYAILRPPEYLEDARERELEIRAAELRVRQLAELSCPNCNFPVEKNYLRCPNCQRRLKDPCHHCGEPVDPRWALCPYCETALPGRSRQGQQDQQPGDRRGSDDSRRASRQQRSEPRPQSGAPPRAQAKGDPGTAELSAPAAAPGQPSARRSRPPAGSQSAEGGSRPPAKKPPRSRPAASRDPDPDGGPGSSA